MYRHAFWLSRNHAEAEDLVQEAIAKSLRAFASFRPDTNFKAWIFRILRNTFLTSRTGIAASRTVALEDQPEAFEISDDGPTPEDQLIRLDNQAAVNAALDQLQPMLREVLLLCDAEELKYKEIAVILDVPIGTVMSRISRAPGASSTAAARHQGVAMTYESGVGEHLAMEQVSAFVDGETSAEESEAVERHLASCHACALRVLAATRMKAATARAAQRFVPPAESLARLRRSSAKYGEEACTDVFSFRRAVGSVAASLLLAFSVFGWRQVHEANRFGRLLDQHLAVLSAGAAPEVISTDRHTVKPWFQGKLPFSFNLPEELPADTVLKGGDLTYLDGKAAALLLFSVHKHQVSCS